MLVIRLRRIGKKNKPTYRVVLAEHTWSASGKFSADLGFYNPHTKEFKVDKDTIMEWLKKGAQPSNTVARLLESIKLKHASIVVVKKSKKSKNAKEEPKAAAPVAAKVEIDEQGEVTAEIETSKDATEEAEKVEEEVKEETSESTDEPAA